MQNICSLKIIAAANAVRDPQNCPYPCAADNTDCICTIFKDSPSEWRDMKKLHDQRLL